MLYDYIIANYDLGEPIFESDINIEGITDICKAEQLKRLVAYRKLIEFANGIYYLPQESDLKGEGTMCADLVARSKYIFRQGKRIGYFGGYTLANLMGISAQVPVKEEYVSNIVQEKQEEEVVFGTRVYIVRKPPVEVTEDNYRTLQLLEILKDIEMYVDVDMPCAEAMLAHYIKKNKVSRENVSKYIGYFPERIYDNLNEMRLDNVLA